MKQGEKRGFSWQERAEFWKRWRQGESLSEIGRGLQKNAASIYGVLRSEGGISPRPRQRSARALSVSEREELSRGLSKGLSVRAMALEIKRSPSTVSREINRNGGRAGHRASSAELRADRLRTRPQPCKLDLHATLRNFVANRLEKEWSPSQISGWLKRHVPLKASMQVSHEKVYKTLYIQSRGVLRQELRKHLRTQRPIRKARSWAQHRPQRTTIKDGVSISERPPEAADRAVPGHWEGDLIIGSKQSQVATLVERHSRFVMLVKVPKRDSANVVRAIIRKIRRLTPNLMSTLTWDRGTELAYHKRITIATDVKVFFCDPQSPWQRGSNENTNGLLRQYFPKKTCLSGFSQKQLDKVAFSLNTRPRKTLAFLTPIEKLSQTV